MSLITMCALIVIMGIKHHIKLGSHKLIFLATSVTKTLDHNKPGTRDVVDHVWMWARYKTG